jgi:outer membrane protein
VDAGSLRACLTAVMLLAAAGVTRAENIEDAWRMARETDPTLAAAQSEAAAADSGRLAAERQRWPVLRANTSYTQLNESPAFEIVTPAGTIPSQKIWRNDGFTLAGVEVAVPLWTGGKISGAIGAATADSVVANAQARQASGDLELAVVKAYLGVLRARRALSVADSNVASLDAHAAAVQVMYQKEAVAQNDLLAAQVALSNARQERLRAANGVRLATAGYNRHVGQPLDRIPDLDDPSNAATADIGARDKSSLVAQALDRRPELEALRAAQSSYGHAADAARAERWPQLQLKAGYSHIDNQILDRENFAYVGVGFEWRLFDSGQTAAKAAALGHRARAAERQLADAHAAIELEVEDATLRLDEATARVALSTEAITQAEENLRIARELYGSGLGTNTQVLDAETLRVAALTNHDNARYDRLQAIYELRHATGAIGAHIP